MGGRSLADMSGALLATCGGDTVKLFDLTVDSGDPCVLRCYTPTPGPHVNSVKSNHTNLVVVGAGEDQKISLWLKHGQSVGTVLPAGSDAGVNNISILECTFFFLLLEDNGCCLGYVTLVFIRQLQVYAGKD